MKIVGLGMILCICKVPLLSEVCVDVCTYVPMHCLEKVAKKKGLRLEVGREQDLISQLHVTEHETKKKKI